jgi:hypothetical protein
MAAKAFLAIADVFEAEADSLNDRIGELVERIEALERKSRGESEDAE